MTRMLMILTVLFSGCKEDGVTVHIDNSADPIGSVYVDTSEDVKNIIYKDTAK